MLVLEPHSLVMKKVDTRDDEEADDTLSFSDLALYSDQSVEEYWEEEEEEDLSVESQGSSSISSSDHDYFEFSSQELSPFAAAFPPENIIFCGKLIPYNKQSNTSEYLKSPSRTLVDNKKKQTSIKKTRGWGLFKQADKQVQSKSRVVKHEYERGYDFPVQKMSILTSSSSGKARWYLFLFGISRFSSEVELSDIKTRQRSHRRRHCSEPPPPPPQSPALRFRNHHHEVTRGSGLWGLIKVLSCGGNHHPNAMVVSSIDSH